MLFRSINLADSYAVTAQFLASIVENFTMLESQFPRGWFKINDDQTVTWNAIGNNQSITWQDVGNGQNPNWVQIDNTQV